MIGLGLDFDSRTSQNLIDFFPPHTVNSGSGSGKGLNLNKEYQDLDFFPSHTISNVKKKKC